jgi:hypothetical protein
MSINNNNHYNHRPDTEPTAPLPAHGWAQIALWVPVGFAATRMLGDGAPLLSVLALGVLIAVVHFVAPSTTELLVGGAGLVISLYHAIDGHTTGELLGPGATAVVLVFGSVILVSTTIAWLGPFHFQRAGRHLIVATAALELALFTVSPLGRTVVSSQDRFTLPAVVGGILFIATPVGVRSRHGLPLLGTALVLTQGALLATGSVTGYSPLTGLVGSFTFASVALLLESLATDEEAAFASTANLL